MTKRYWTNMRGETRKLLSPMRDRRRLRLMLLLPSKTTLATPLLLLDRIREHNPMLKAADPSLVSCFSIHTQ